jgi:hypothetical protein
MFFIRYFFVSFILSSLLIFGCTTSDIKPSSSGKPGELLIVIDSLLWKGEPGRILRDSLFTPFPALPQDEPLFRPVIIQPGDFKGILQLHQNILIVEIGPLQNNRDYALSFKHRVWSDPQIVLNLRARDETFLEAALMTFAGSIIQKITEEEGIRMVRGLRSLPEIEVMRKMNELTGIYVPLTADYYIAKSESSYTWLRKETIHMSTGYQVYRLPYNSDSVFNTTSIIALRDSLSKQHIPGPSTGSYMTTEMQFPVFRTTTTIDSCYAVELRGLWRMEGDFMGGPFLSYLIHDQKRDSLLFVDAFLYAPKFKKREYVKQMEATVRAMKFR